MPSINFKARFVPLIESGRKRHTIRKLRKRPIYEGDVLYLFTGMRTKSCRRIGQFECLRVKAIIIETGMVEVDQKILNPKQFEQLAVADGFHCFQDFMKFFTKIHRLPFEGQIIHW